MNDASLIKSFKVARKLSIISSDELDELLFSFDNGGHIYPFSIGKDRYRDNKRYIQLLNNKKKGHYHGTTTGSSGEPFTAIIDFKTRLYRGLHWKLLMGRVLDGSTLILMWRNKQPSFYQNISIMRSKLILSPVYDLTGGGCSYLDRDIVRKTLKNFPEGKKLTLRTYVSVLVYLSKNFEKELKKLNFIKVIASAETLNFDDWDLIESSFGCPCINVYGGTEASPLAISTSYDRRLKIQNNLFHVGIQADGSENKIIITDRINRLMPLVSYDIGDLTSGIKETHEGIFLIDVKGRTSEVIQNIDGKNISSHFVHIIFRDKFEISKYRIYYQSKGLLSIELEGFYGENISNDTLDEIKCAFKELGFKIEKINKTKIEMLSGMKHRTIIRV